MRYAIFILVILSIPLGAIALDSARFDWSLGTPSVVDDSTTSCNNQATVRYDWTLGVPDSVYDSTATCAGGGGGTPTVSSHLYIKDGNALYIKNGNSFYIKR